ncbi:MAG: hypothetical protein WCD81_10425 [Candidatus Bathyarchaeia archaeon]
MVSKDFSLKFVIPFNADKVDSQLAIRERLLNIEGVAIDTSVNANKWQIPPEDLDYFTATLKGAQLRVDHAESALAVIGIVPEARRVGSQVVFRAEIGDAALIEKILRGYISNVSAQVDSDNVECSKCLKQTRKEGMLIHLCPGAWEIVHKPKVRELSIVASPAYEKTKFLPVGFAQAMDASQSQKFSAEVGNPMQPLTKGILVLKLKLLTREVERQDIAARIAAIDSQLAEWDLESTAKPLHKYEAKRQQRPQTFMDELHAAVNTRP